MQPTPTAELDRAIQTLAQNRERWAGTGLPARVEILERLARDTLAVSREMVAAACRAKGIDLDRPAAAEEWFGGPVTILRNVRLLAMSLREIARKGRPKLARGDLRRRVDGTVSARIFPMEWKDGLLYSGFTADVWMEPGISEDDVLRTMARAYESGPRASDGRVSLVLGAGNVASIGPMDVLYKLFNENQVVLLKMNPVNEYLGPFIERAFKVLVDEGWLRVVYGGAEVGSYLVVHEGIDNIHITGSTAVHDAIVWGPPGPAQDEAKRTGARRTNKPITSELGCVTPVVLVPGDWSEKEIEFQAQNVATMLANNASFNCNAAKVLVTSRDWPGRKPFLDRLEEILRALPSRKAYYPGSRGKYERFLAAHPESKKLSAEREDAVPWTLIRDVAPDGEREIAFREEAWCGILAETGLEARDAGEFLARATDFCNDRLWGTLSCSVIVDPKTEKRLGADFERAVADLRYGSVAINHWAGLSYGLAVTPWGAHPGHTLEDVGSGIGFVHNTLLLDRPRKSVVRGPFTVFPKPPWFVTHSGAHKVAPKIAEYEGSPSVLRIPGIAAATLGG